MSLPKLTNLEARAGEAVGFYWRTLVAQEAKQRTRGDDADRGRRGAVTGGKQMIGFSRLVCDLLKENGLPAEHIHLDTKLDLPGYFRASKTWDMLVVYKGNLLAAIEFKSQRGPSFGNNFNNRAEEAIGTGVDLWRAYREGAFGKKSPRPFLGWLMLLEDCRRSQSAVKPKASHFNIFPEFKGSSYAKRYELLLRRLMLERLYDGAAFMMATESEGPRGKYSEPASDLSIRKCLAGLVGHVGASIAGTS